MSKLLEALNPKQKEAVLYNDGPLAIIAGAGSGKTRVITYKIAYLIQTKNIKPYKILAVTFTNKAANEMKQRVEKLVNENMSQIKISTYHSLCSRILREDIEYLDLFYTKNFNIIDPTDQRQILKKGYKKFDISYRTISYSSTINAISKFKNKKMTVQELKRVAKNDIDKAYANLYDFYLEETKLSNSLDFDDLLIYVDKLFIKDEEVANKWASKFEYVLVDEFQDTSKIQYNIIKKISQNSVFIVVGDPDQNIYTWRNADTKFIMNFEKEHNNSKIILLQHNYRSTQTILNAANTLIKENNEGTNKKLFTEKEKGEEIEYYDCFSEEDEVNRVGEKIDSLIFQGEKLNDIAILYRSNFLSNALEKLLIIKKINYIVYGSVHFYQREEIKDVVAYLKLINNGDVVALERMLNIPARNIGAVSKEKIYTYLNKYGINIFNLFYEFNDFNKLNELNISSKAKTELFKFINLIVKSQKEIKTKSIKDVIENFLKEVEYHKKWSSDEYKSRIENIQELIKDIDIWEQKNKNKNLSDYINDISLYTDYDMQDKIKGDKISLMTIHSSKGLEFKHIFIFGMSESIFPSRKSLEETAYKGIEEERRLAYVAITRAKDKLYISSSRGFSFINKNEKKPSQFIKEMGINNFTAGDNIIHKIFGKGVVLSTSERIMEVAFKDPYGIKRVAKNHFSIKKENK